MYFMIIITHSKKEDRKIINQRERDYRMGKKVKDAYIFRVDGENIVWGCRYKNIYTLSESIARQMADNVFCMLYGLGEGSKWDNKRWKACIARAVPRIERVLKHYIK